MQQFQVPQFITVEDRIVGPFTLKQFLYLLGAGGILLVTWALFNFFLFVLIGFPIAGFFTAMAFLKINDQPFPTVFMNGMNYYLKPRLYLWQQSKLKKGTPPASIKRETSPLAGVSTVTESKLSDLAWSLDINEKIKR